MSDKPVELKAFAAGAITTLRDMKPTLEGVLKELQRQQLHNHDHEHFMIQEFRNLTRAIEQLTAQLAKMAA